MTASEASPAPIGDGHVEFAPTPAHVKRATGWIAKGTLVLLPAIAGAGAGAAIQYYVQIARPQATLLYVTLPSLSDVTAKKDKKIKVPANLRELTRKSRFFPDLDAEENRGTLASYVGGIRDTQSQIPTDLAWIDSGLHRLNSTLSVDDKRIFLEEMARDENVRSAFEGGLAREESRYLPSAAERAGPAVIHYQEEHPGFQFDLPGADWKMTYNNDSSFDARLKPGAEALAAFNQDYIKRVLANARADIIEMDGECSKVADELNKLIYHSEGLHVRSLVVNSGGSPVSLTPWAALRLFSSGNQPDFVVPLHGSEGSYPSIKPGESQQLDFDSIETVEQIEMKYPGIENILKSETILSRLALKRADLAGDGGWITTATRTLTANEDAEPEARRVGAALKK